jgi:hypothetical protein
MIILFCGLKHAPPKYNNAFTWSGPRGVVGRAGQAPYEQTGPLCAIEPVESSDGKKTSAEEKDYDSGFGRGTICRTRTRCA